MKTISILLAVAAAVGSLHAQAEQRPSSEVRAGRTAPSPSPTPRDEKAELAAATAFSDPLERLNSLRKFISDFPQSTERRRAEELSVSAMAELAETRFAEDRPEDAVALFKAAVGLAPEPVSDALFSRVMLQFPENLYGRGQRAAAFEVAEMIEAKAGSNARQLLGLATFFIGIEYASEAIRLAGKATDAEPGLAVAYYTLGTANRLGFRLDAAATAFAKGLELEPSSVQLRRSLADVARATGKSEQALGLYRGIASEKPDDAAALAGIALTLFDLGKREEAEAAMAKALDADASDATLLAGSALWYAANGEGAKAVELADRARAAEPKFAWGYIAGARGNMALGRPLEAERLLLLARAVANFPTLDYELAAARYSAGLYREAADALGGRFSLEDGRVVTYLGNRILADADTFPELISLEHKASIQQPNVGHDAATAAGLKNLLEFASEITAKERNPASVAAAADRFAAGEDAMRAHRQLFAASRLLQYGIEPDKAFELARGAVANLDAALEVTTPSVATLADEIYESRMQALSRGEMVVVPEIPRQTLSAILRGRLEELSGWAFLLKGEPAQAVVRFRRGLSVLPEKSIWWRSSNWRLGSALESEGKEKEALDAYIRAFNRDFPNPEQYGHIAKLYEKVNGGLEGLQERIGPNPGSSADAAGASAEADETNERTDVKPETANAVPTAESAERRERIPDFVPIETAEPRPAEPTAKPAEARLSEDVPSVKPAAETKPESKDAPKEAAPEEPSKETPDGPETAPASDGKETRKKDDGPTREPAAEENPAEAGKKDGQTPAKDEPAAKTEKPEDDRRPDEPAVEPDATTSDTPAPAEVEEKRAEEPAKPAPKPLFEPIVISAPARGAEPDGRSRVVEGEKTGARPDAPAACSIVPTRGSVSIFANGGMWGLFVGVENGALADVKASTDSASDISVKEEKPAEDDASRRFFVIRSVSRRTGDFKVTFTAPCGSKDVAVTVTAL